MSLVIGDKTQVDKSTMDKARERHIRYYLAGVKVHQEDIAWFDTEWPQIEHGWRMAQDRVDTSLLLEFAMAVIPLMGPRGLWSSTLA